MILTVTLEKHIVSDTNGDCRWLDNVVSSHWANKMIKSINVLSNFIISDHRPIELIIELNDNNLFTNELIEDSIKNRQLIEWQSLSDESINLYNNFLQNNDLEIPNSVINLNENDQNVYKNEINSYYNDIVNSFLLAGKHISKEIKRKNKKYKVIPGWHEYVQEHHAHARDCYKQWRIRGSPRNDLFHYNMYMSRIRFKNALKTCKRNEKQIINDKIAQKFTDKDNIGFWKEINKLNNKKSNLPNNVGGEVGKEKITKLWRDHFKCILTDVNRDFIPDTDILDYNENMKVFPEEIVKAVKNLKRGKSVGMDELSAEHLIYAHKFASFHLNKLFTAIFRYSYIPDKFMDVIMVPLVKNKCGDITSINNYRPISLSNVISKVFEAIIVEKCKDYLIVNDNQFAFKDKLSTEMCVYTLKQILFEYKNRNTPIFSCFLDIKKAYDRINNDKLISILKKRNIPDFILRIFKYWFYYQKFFIRWQGVLSLPFFNTCGLRQGSKLSPLLFNVYINILSNELNKLKIGCVMGGVVINHLCYADDTALFTPSAKSLQLLIKTCEKIGNELDIKFNVNKTKCMIFKTKRYNDISITFQLYNREIELVENFKYLGITISNDLKDNIEMKNQYRSICTRSNMLIRKFGNCSNKVKVNLFKTYCTSIYGLSLWCNFNKRIININRVCYNNSLRFLLNLDRFCSASEMCASRNIPSFNELIRLRQFSFKNNISNTCNSLIEAVSSCEYINSTIWKYWRESLYI